MIAEEIERILATITETLRESAQQQSRTDIQMADTDRRMAETDRRMAETDRRMAETDRKLDRLSELFGNNNKNQGDIAESFFYSSLVANPVLGEQHFDTVIRNLEGNRAGVQDEFDIILENTTSVAVIEVKGKAHQNDIEKLISRKIPRLKALFPYYKNFKVYGAIASLADYELLRESARAAGVFYLTQRGNHLVVTHDNVIAY